MPWEKATINKQANPIKDTPPAKPSNPSVSFIENVVATKTKTKKNIYQIPKPTSPKKGYVLRFLSNLAQNHHAPIKAINV